MRPSRPAGSPIARRRAAALVLVALAPIAGGCAALALPVGVAAIAPHLPPASDTSRAPHPLGAAVRATLEPARDVPAIDARGDTVWLRGTTLLIGTVARTRGDTSWIALTTQRDRRGDTRHWGRQREALVALVPGSEVRVARIARNARAGDALVAGSLAGALCLLVAIAVSWDAGT